MIVKDPVASTKSFSDLGLSAEDIINLGLSPKELVNQSGLTINTMRNLGVDANTLLIGGKTELELYNSDYTICDIAVADNSDLSNLIHNNSIQVTSLDFLECNKVYYCKKELQKQIC